MIYILLMKISALDYTSVTSYSKSRIKKNVDQFKRSLVRTSQRITPINRKDPDELFGHLFHEVQAQQIYQDGKTFVDVVPKSAGDASSENTWKPQKNPILICKNLSINIFMILIRRMQVTCLSQPNQRASMSRSYGRS